MGKKQVMVGSAVHENNFLYVTISKSNHSVLKHYVAVFKVC